MGAQSILRDLGHQVELKIESDATAALGMAKRQGLGRVRHLAVADLWLQQKVRDRQFQLSKIAGKENPADALTKVLSADHGRYLLSKLGFVYLTGRPKIAPMRTQMTMDGYRQTDNE